MSPEQIKEELAKEREALLANDSSKKEDIEILIKAEKYAKAELKGLQEVLRKAKVTVTPEQAITIQEEVLKQKLEWLRSQKQPIVITEVMEGWN